MRTRSKWSWLCVMSVILIAGVVSAPVSATPEPDPADVRAELARRRELALERLHAYRVAGVFPTDELGLPLGVFRDDHGVRCPMSELIFQSGHPELVDEVVRTNNRIKLADVTDGALMDWMLGSGLTRDEIIAIQGVMEYGNSFDVNLNSVRLVNNLERVNEAHANVDRNIAELQARLAAQRERSLTSAAARLTRQQRAQLIRN